MPSIHLLPLGDVAPDLPSRLAAPLEARFAAPVRVEPPAAAPPMTLDPARGQYDGAALLAALVAAPPPDAGWGLALLAGDLFAPGLAFAFGLSTIGGCCGIVALARLDPTFHGAAPDPERYFKRVLTEAVHEIGHMAGLDHCEDEHCVMYFSSDVHATDRKGLDFCVNCRR